MVDVCDPSNFPPEPYFSQNEIPDPIPAGYDYVHIRGLKIEAKGSVSGHDSIDTLGFFMEDALLSGGKYPGVPKSPGVTWETKIPDLFNMGLARGNPFDFKLWFRSRVAFLLVGNFWRFSTTMEPFTTKHDYDGQYFNLLLHYLDENGDLQSVTREEWATGRPDQPCKCISLYAREPCRDSQLPPPPVSPRVLHGFSLNIEVGNLRGDGSIDPALALPITFDPDVENKGGNPGP